MMLISLYSQWEMSDDSALAESSIPIDPFIERAERGFQSERVNTEKRIKNSGGQ